MLSLDQSRALRRHGDLRALAEAILAAPEEEAETHAIEWKSELELGAAEANFACARQVLGFANRDPDRAAVEFEGCAYLVVGVKPGRVVGVEAHDPADVDNWLSEYLGADGPHWQPAYVELGGRKVLVIGVEAPRWGDPIQTLRKGHGGHRAGRIFIRRAGKTIEADPAEVRMLEERARRSGERIALGLEAVVRGGTLRPYLADRRDREAWIENERWRLNTAVDEHRSAQRERGFNLSYLEQETRSVAAYREETDRYLRRARGRWQGLLWEGVMGQRIGEVALTIENPSERNFEAVEVGLSLPEDAHPFAKTGEALRRVDAPEPPIPFGQRTQMRKINALVEGSEPIGRPEVRIETSGGRAEVVYAPRHVRPRQRHPLPPLHLALPGPLVGETVEIAWRATSTSADGDVGGTLTLPVATEAPVGADNLVAYAEGLLPS